MSNRKIQKTYTDNGFGFPVKFINAPMIKIRNEWVLDVNFEKYEKVVLIALANKPARLTGNEVKFIRHHFQMKLETFGRRFGNVAHSAVIKWEKMSDTSTNMNWATEKDIRLAIIDKLKPKVMRAVYERLEEVAPSTHKSIKIDSKELKAA